MCGARSSFFCADSTGSQSGKGRCESVTNYFWLVMLDEFSCKETSPINQCYEI